MYLRRQTISKQGKRHTYWRLVRSVRRGRRVSQETVAYLGELDAEGRAKASALARHFLGGKLDGQGHLFDDTPPIEAASVKVREVRVERSRSFGDVWLGWLLWQALGLDDFCRRQLSGGREAVGWAEVATILVLARLCDPSSELHIAEQWYRKTALEDLLGVPEGRVHHTRLYQGLDQLLPHKAALESHLRERFATLFDQAYDLLLYDVTSTYFEGRGCSLAKRGYSRDHRPDCVQVCLALVVTADGFPVGHEVFEGNRTDVTTVEEVVEAVEAKYGRTNRVWVMDRGMVSEDNLSWLRSGGRRYLVGTPKSELKTFQKQLVETEGWKAIRDGLEVKICPGPESEEVFLLCRSADRQAKEAAMHERFSARITQALENLSRRLEHAKSKANRAQVERQIGRLLQRNSRAAGKYQITVEEDESRPSGLRLSVVVRGEWSQWALHTEGTYILRSNVVDWSPEQLWKAYIQLTQAEDAFRAHKTELEIRPIWHQKDDRVRAHILVCFLAFALWKTMEGWADKAGLGRSPRKLLEEMAAIASVDVVLPLTDGRELRLRCVVRPDKEQAVLLQRLGLQLPRRLRLPAAGLPA